jgi:hypothetical protein
MAQTESFTETLAVALQRVADEHEAHLKVHGPDKPWPDSDWPRWYAERLTASLGDDRAELQGILETAFRHAASAHGVHEEFVLKGVHDVEWPAWYAEQMTGTLGANASRLEPGIKAYLAS